MVGQLIRRKRDGAIFRIQCIARYAPSTGLTDKALLLNMHGMYEWRSLRYVQSYCRVTANSQH